MNVPTLLLFALAATAQENCHFPIDVVIAQDATTSFAPHFKEMRERQLSRVVTAVEPLHPGSRFGLISFKDKPIGDLGMTSDYCYRVDLPATQGFESIYEAYGGLWSNGGRDLPENSFGALYSLAVDPRPWNHTKQQRDDTPELIVLITDAPPHFTNDGSEIYGLKPFDGWSVDRDQTVCTDHDYPSAEQVKEAIKKRGAYVAFFIIDSPDGKTYPTWEWFNSLLGQPDIFIARADENSSNFFRQLSMMIGTIEREECGKQMMTAPPTTAPPPTTRDSSTAECPAETTDRCASQRRRRPFGKWHREIIAALDEVIKSIENSDEFALGLSATGSP